MILALKDYLVESRTFGGRGIADKTSNRIGLRGA